VTHQSAPHRIVLESPTLKPGARVPRQHTAAGENVSPELAWRQLPPNTKQLVVMCEDRDTFVPNQVPFLHWVVHSIPPAAMGLPEGMPHVPVITAPPDLIGAVQTRTAFDVTGYRGPQPLVGEKPHTYRFVVYALDAELTLDHDAAANAVLDAIRPHVIGEGEIIATFSRDSP
jgi:Raf kinase inhibitor-like YbhB/YbcL family protein